MESDSSTTIQPAGKGRRNKKRRNKKVFVFVPRDYYYYYRGTSLISITFHKAFQIVCTRKVPNMTVIQWSKHLTQQQPLGFAHQVCFVFSFSSSASLPSMASDDELRLPSFYIVKLFFTFSFLSSTCSLFFSSYYSRSSSYAPSGLDVDKWPLAFLLFSPILYYNNYDYYIQRLVLEGAMFSCSSSSSS